MTPTEMLENVDYKGGVSYVIKYDATPFSSFSTDSDPITFHLAIWRCQTGNSNFSMSWNVANREDRFVMFGTKEIYESYLEWFAEYERRFPEKNFNKVCFPPLPKTGRYELTFVDTRPCDVDDTAMEKRDEVTKRQFEQWGWVVEHCSGLAFMVNEYCFAFENETDAMQFKIVHG